MAHNDGGSLRNSLLASSHSDTPPGRVQDVQSARSSQQVGQLSAALRSTLGMVLEGSTVTIVIPGGPAWRLAKDGMRIDVGDIVRKVDGLEVTSSNASAAMRGSDLPGTPVRVEVEKNSSSGKWTSNRSMLPAKQSKLVEFVVVRQDVEMVMLLKNVQYALSTAWKVVGDGSRELEDLERCIDAVVGFAAEDDARLRQAVREMERKSGLNVGGDMQVDMAMLTQQAANEVSQAHQRIRTLEMQLELVNAEIELSREEERRARAAALEAQDVFRRNDGDLRGEIYSLQEGMVRLDRRVRDESARADEESERADKLIEEGRVLRSNTEAMQIELERFDLLKNKSAKASSEAVALALREVLLVQDELSAAKEEIEQMKGSETLVNERLRVIEAARDTIDLGEGHRNEQLKTLRSEVIFLRKTIEAIKDERAQMREHIAKQAREIVVLDSKVHDKFVVDNQELENTKADLFKTKNALRLRETQIIALEEELRRRTHLNSSQAVQGHPVQPQIAARSLSEVLLSPKIKSSNCKLPFFNMRVDDTTYVLIAALVMALVVLAARSVETLGHSLFTSLIVMTSGIFCCMFSLLALFKCAIWLHGRFVSGTSPAIVASLPEKTPLLPTAAENYQQIPEPQYSNRQQPPYKNAPQSSYGSRPPSQLSDRESLRNPDFKYVAKYPSSSVYTPTGGEAMMSRDSGDPSAYHATQTYLSMTSGRPLSCGHMVGAYQPQDQPYQAHARDSDQYSVPLDSNRLVGGDAAVTARSSMGASMMSRRSREERLASLKGTVKRHEDHGSIV